MTNNQAVANVKYASLFAELDNVCTRVIKDFVQMQDYYDSKIRLEQHNYRDHEKNSLENTVNAFECKKEAILIQYFTNRRLYKLLETRMLNFVKVLEKNSSAVTDTNVRQYLDNLNQKITIARLIVD